MTHAVFAQIPRPKGGEAAKESIMAVYVRDSVPMIPLNLSDVPVRVDGYINFTPGHPCRSRS